MEFVRHHRGVDSIRDKATKSLGLRRDTYYTLEEIQFVKDNYYDKGAAYCAHVLGVSTACVSDLATKRLGLAKSHPVSKKLTPEMRQYIIDNYEQYGLAILQHPILTGVTRGALKNQAQTLGLVSRALRPSCKKVYCKELDMAFDSVNAAERYMCELLNKKRYHLKEAMKTENKVVAGYHWEYVDYTS